jgi:ABC-type dipeptide/oligopeptide/nickel transport system permease subunit
MAGIVTLRNVNWEFATGTILLAFILGMSAWIVLFPSHLMRSEGESFERALLWQEEKQDGLNTRTTSNLDGLRSQDGETISKAQLHLFGTDLLGRDIFRQTMIAPWRYVAPALVVLISAIVFGCLFGVAKGYYDGRGASSLLEMTSNALSVFPQLLLLYLLVVILGSTTSLFTVALVFGITEASRIGHIISNKIKSLNEEDFIAAAKEMGLSDWRIITKHILWLNCRELLVIQCVFSAAAFIMIEVYLGYLGAARGFSAWGEILGNFYGRIEEHPWLVLPFGVVALLIAALYLIGDGLTRMFKAEGDIAKA